jgi:hypothetical protein
MADEKKQVVYPSSVQAPSSRTNFAPGQKVRIAKKSFVIDKEREAEHLAPEDRIPIEENVTGLEGEIAAPPYESPSKGNAVHIPIRVPEGGILGVPEDRLEAVEPASVSGGRVATGFTPRYAKGWKRVFKKKTPRPSKKTSERK